MKKIIITTQDEFDKIRRINADEEVIFESNDIEINCILEVYGTLRLKGKIQSSWNCKIYPNVGVIAGPYCNAGVIAGPYCNAGVIAG